MSELLSWEDCGATEVGVRFCVTFLLILLWKTLGTWESDIVTLIRYLKVGLSSIVDCIIDVLSSQMCLLYVYEWTWHRNMDYPHKMCVSNLLL